MANCARDISLMVFVVALLLACCTGESTRSLQQTAASRAANTLRSQAATSGAITRAVQSGAAPKTTKNAAGVGSTTSFALAQNNGQIFDQVEFATRNGGRKLQQTGTSIYTGDAIRRAVNSGAAPRAVRNAAGVGSTTTFAAAQGDRQVLDQVLFANRGGRKLQQTTANKRATNTLRSEQATADAIQRAVSSGARQGSTVRAAGVGSATVFANAQNDGQLFDQVEFVARNGRKLQQTTVNTRAANTLRSQIATADAIQRATNSGARQGSTKNAAGVGSTTVFANANGNGQVFDQVENVARSGRKLQQTTVNTRAANTLRSQIATADAIQRATNSGARQGSTKNAAGVGSTTVFANANGNGQLFDQVENVARSGRKLQQNNVNTHAANTLRSQIATADAIQRATNSGARQGSTKNAAGVGSTTVFANANGSGQVFDQVENVARSG